MARKMPGQIGEQTPGRVTMQQIAEFCGVTKGTVSLALRGHGSIGMKTTARVVAAARELGYNPALHDAARRLAMLRKNERAINRVITLFYIRHFYPSTGGFFSQLFYGVLEGARDNGFGLLVDYFDANSPLLPLFERSDVDAVIFYGRSLDTIGLETRLRDTPGFADRPIVTLLAPNPECASVDTDDCQATRQAMRHLLERGHRHVLQLIYPIYAGIPLAPVDRIRGAAEVFAEAGLDPAQRHLLECSSLWMEPNSLPAGHKVTNPPIPDDDSSHRLLAYLRAHPEITAVLALNDACAFRVWQTLYHAGIRVPEDISIIGFDDTDPVFDEHGANQLTTIRVPLYDIGFQAAQLAIAQTLGAGAAITRMILPTELVVRGSTGPAKRQA